MRVAAVLLSLSFSMLLLGACARTGDQNSMTPRDTSDIAPASPAIPVSQASEDTGTAAPAPVRNVRTATFALG